MDHSHDKHYTPEEEFDIAKGVYESSRDLTHAVYHLGNALTGNPIDADRLEFLDKILDEAPDPLALVPLDFEKGVDYVTASLHAYILARIGRPAEAVNLILQVQAAVPHIQYLPWAIRWLVENPAARSQVAFEKVIPAVFSINQRWSGDTVSGKQGTSEITRALRLIELVAPEPTDNVRIEMARSVMTRKLGKFDAAIRIAESAHARMPDYLLATSAGMAYGAKGDFDGWLRWYLVCLEHDPENVPTRLDLGDRHLDRDLFADAVRWYQEALDRDPANEWALPSVAYARWKNDEGDEWLAQLQAFARANPNNERAQDLAWKEEPYIGFLPLPSDATAKLLGNLWDQVQKGDSVGARIVVSSTAIEPPSVRAAVEMQFASWSPPAAGEKPRPSSFSTGYPIVTEPDPRYPRLPVRFQVWEYVDQPELDEDGKSLLVLSHPTMAPPSRDVQALVRRLVNQTYRRPLWYSYAAQLVPTINQLEPDDLIAAMGNPPPLPGPKVFAPNWIFHWQVAAAMLAAHLDPKTPWESSLRREVLLDVAQGPLDWTIDAVVIVLGEVACHEPAAAEDIAETFATLWREPPRPGHVSYLSAIRSSVKFWPAAPAELQELVVSPDVE